MSRVKLVGEWDRTGKLLKLASDRFDEESTKALDEAAKMYEEEVYEIVNSGGLPEWPELSEEWEERKHGPTPYINTGQFLAKIENRQIKGSYRGQTRFVGASPYSIHGTEKNRIRMDELAKVLQENYDRPLFGPAWERSKGRVMARLQQVGEDILR